MENKGGLRIVGKGGGKDGVDEPALGATGFYYVTVPDAWDEQQLSRRRRIFGVITLPAYIWRELLKGVFLSLAVFSLILMAVFSGQVLRDGVGPYTMLKVLPNFLPLICPFVLPLAIITGVIICYGRLAKDNEILAAYAGGINPLWLIMPTLLTSVIAIFITLTLNEVALMRAITNIERLVVEDQANILRRMIARPGNVTVQTGDEYIAMSKLDPALDPTGRASLDITRFGNVENPYVVGDTFAWDPFFPHPTKRVVARDHVVQDFSETGSEEMMLKMLVNKPVFQDLHVSDINRTFIADGEAGEERIVLGGRPNVTIHSNRSAFWPILKLAESRSEAEARVAELHSRDDGTLSESQRFEIGVMLDRLVRVVQHRTADINMRLALCFSCLAFGILGIPLGMRSRGTLVVSFAIGIATAGIYFLSLKSAESQVGNGLLPYWVIWIPDAVVMVLGLVLWCLNSRRV